MKIHLDSLPKSVLSKIPLSIRTFKKEYELEELPFPVQKLIEEYSEKTVNLEYPPVYDIRPEISNQGDFQILNTVEDTVVYYFLNYLRTLPGEYPFDPTFGCKLKLYLQTRDTGLRQTLISTEATKIAETISSDFGEKVEILDINVTEQQLNIDSAGYLINILIRINDREKRIEYLEMLA